MVWFLKVANTSGPLKNLRSSGHASGAFSKLRLEKETVRERRNHESLFQRHRIEFPLPRKESEVASRGRQIKKKKIAFLHRLLNVNDPLPPSEKETHERFELAGLRIHDENVAQFVYRSTREGRRDNLII